MRRLQFQRSNLGLCQSGLFHLLKLLWSAPVIGCALLKGQINDLGHLAAGAGCLRPEHGKQEVRDSQERLCASCTMILSSCLVNTSPTATEASCDCRANIYWEASLPTSFKRPSEGDIVGCKKFIEDKYRYDP